VADATVSEAVPTSFRAYLVGHREGEYERGVRTLTTDDLPAGDVTVRVEWSGVNYKDGLAARADGKVARIDPLVPGIDLAGTVLTSTDHRYPPGSAVIATGFDLGVARHGGYGEIQRLPADWCVPRPARLTARDAMAIGTAGFTAAMAVEALEARGLAPDHGPVLVTGAAGGLGRLAVGILAELGYEAWAATGKPDEADGLRRIGAAGVLRREEVTAAPRPLGSVRWAGAIDAVGGPTLPYILSTLVPGAAVAACGNAGGAELTATVLPFILRGVAVLGINSVPVPAADRSALWNRLATDLRPRGLGTDLTEVALDGLGPALDAVVEGRARGRWIVRVGARAGS
jgi:acrylyl-CoA reductase (NADPH)